MKSSSNFTILNNDIYNCVLKSSLSNKIFTNDSGIHYYYCNKSILNCDICSNNGSICENCYLNYGLICDKKNYCYSIGNFNGNYYKNNELNCYSKCKIENCNDCSVNMNQCEKCSNSYTILNNDIYNCVLKSSLSNKIFTNDSGIHYYYCNKSISNCNICSNNGSICENCYSNYYFLNDDKTKCHKETDLKSQYGNKIYKHDEYKYYSCNKGVNNCERCNNSTYCNSCEKNYGLICNENSKCYPIENFEKYYFKNNLYNCYEKSNNFGCDECTSEKNCTSCIENYTLYGKVCYSDENIGEQTCIKFKCHHKKL